MAVRCVVFEQTLSGPAVDRDNTLASLQSAGFDARPIDCPYGDDSPAAEDETDTDRARRIRDEQAKTWLVAEMVLPQQPTADDQTALMARAAEASGRFGFELRMHGAAWTWRDPEGGR